MKNVKNKLYFISSKKNNNNKTYEKSQIALLNKVNIKILLVEEIHRINLQNFHSNKIILPKYNSDKILKLGLNPKNKEFCFIGNKGTFFFNLDILIKNNKIKRVFDPKKNVLFFYFIKAPQNNLFKEISKNIQNFLYYSRNNVLIGSCKKIYIKGKGKKFTSINQTFFNVSLQKQSDLIWFSFFQDELKYVFNSISNQGFLLDLSSNEDKIFKSIIDKNYTIIVEVLNKTQILVHGTNKKWIGDFVYKIKKNYPINPYTGEGIHTSLNTITPTKSGKKI
jgi:hypothetical protein